MKQGLISIIVPCYNSEKYLQEALASVLQQSIARMEVVIVDDGSQNNLSTLLKAILTGYPYQYHRHEKNRGIGAALNTGIAQAAGKYLAFIDSDDLWHPNKIARQWQCWVDQPQVDMVFTHLQNFMCPSVAKEKGQALQFPTNPIPGYHIGTMLIKKESFETVGSFQTQYNKGCFIEWYHRAKQCGLKMTMLTQTLYRRRIHGANLSISKSSEDYSDYLHIIKKIVDRNNGIKQ